MNQLKEQIENGKVQLAKMGPNNQPVPMSMKELQQKQKSRNRQAQILRKLQQLQPQQKLEWVHIKRLHANQLVKAKKWDEAIQLYLQTLLGVNVTEKDPSKLKAANIQVKYPILLNIVTCQYMKKQYQTGVKLCDQIIGQRDGQKNVKAHFKKIYCLMGLGMYIQAKEILKKTYKFVQANQPQDNKPITMQDLQKANAQIRKKLQDEKDVYSRIFNEKDQETQRLVMTKSSLAPQQQLLVYRQSFMERINSCCRQCYEWCCWLVTEQKQKQN